ncbi:hypothetical protein FMUND_1536 [Fusarium mundagurra]|uniref:Uncharacterized protein n=1 Tax=Fusarium mundagurra TaxID=1567541 RepID=A0A8H6DQA5_9HYPO|nr:hypothetical protein FMUND_1536 [Fusarium mundagurra]
MSKEKGLGLGIYAQFLQLASGGLLPLGPEMDVEHSSKTENTFAFDTVTTLGFEPTQEYVKQAVQAPAVQTWLNEPRQKFGLVSELFLITGLKLVKGAKIAYSSSQTTAIKGNLGIDVTALRIPFGPKGNWSRTNDDAVESNRASEFVFAFRVKRLRFGRRLKLEEYSKGAFMAFGSKKDEEEGVMVEDVNGADIKTAKAVPDVTENSNVYCVPP